MFLDLFVASQVLPYSTESIWAQSTEAETEPPPPHNPVSPQAAAHYSQALPKVAGLQEAGEIFFLPLKELGWKEGLRLHATNSLSRKHAYVIAYKPFFQKVS